VVLVKAAASIIRKHRVSHDLSIPVTLEPFVKLKAWLEVLSPRRMQEVNNRMMKMEK